jgi:RNA polymerase-binding transcription factor DksA
MINIEKYKTLLEEEKKLVISELENIAIFDAETGTYNPKIDDNQEVESDFADLSSRDGNYEERYALMNVLANKLADINVALHKIEDGTYGICEVSGENIEEARLDIEPTAKVAMAYINK